MSLFEVMFCPREIDFMSTVCKQLTVLTVAHIRAHACVDILRMCLFRPMYKPRIWSRRCFETSDRLQYVVLKQ